MPSISNVNKNQSKIDLISSSATVSSTSSAMVFFALYVGDVESFELHRVAVHDFHKHALFKQIHAFNAGASVGRNHLAAHLGHKSCGFRIMIVFVFETAT